MTVHLNLSYVKTNKDLKNAKMHYMPCLIKSNQEAKVSTYFEPIITEQSKDDKVLKASFRGYPLLGKEIQLPEKYCGVILKETNTMCSQEQRNLYGTQMFDKFTYWNWDSEPSENDKIIKAMDWLEIAEVKILLNAEELITSNHRKYKRAW